MSGYLDHVLARASRRSPALRSRPRSRFEPMSARPADQAMPEAQELLVPAAMPEPAAAALPAWPRAVPGAPTPAMAPGTVPDAAPVVESSPEPAPAAVPLPAAGPAEQASGDHRAPDLPSGGKLAGDLPAGQEPVSKLPAGDRPSRRADTARTGPRTASTKAVPRGRTAQVARAHPLAVPPEPGNPDAPRRPGRPPVSDPAEERAPGSAPEETTGPFTVASTARARAPRRPPRPPTVRANSSGSEALATSGPAQAPGPPTRVDLVGAADPSIAPGPANAPEPPAAVNLVAAADLLAVANPAEPTDPMTDPLAPFRPVIIPPAEGMPERPQGRPAAQPELPAPVVNVTIGRVEVRQPPSPPPVPAAGPRPMSLDEYLDRRNRSLP